MRVVRALAPIAVVGLPVLVGLLTAPVKFAGGSVWPWHPQLFDFDVYRYAGEVLLRGGDIYAETSPETGWAFIYPPVAGLLSVLLALPPLGLVQFGWIVLCVLAIVAILARLGLRGWVLSLVAAAVVYFCEPVVVTLAMGQLGIFLVALVVLDLVPGPPVLARALGSAWPVRNRGPVRGPRLLPTGVLTGLAAAIKLTPGLFAIYLWFARERRSAVTIAGTLLGLTIVAAVALPGESLHYWAGLVQGNTGVLDPWNLTNQSMFGTWLRLAGTGPVQTFNGLVLAAVAGAVGTYAAVRWHRQGKIALAVVLCGVAGLLASPVSWDHHFVWVVPLGVVLLDRELPTVLRVLGWVFVVWVSAAPFTRLPVDGDVELDYRFWEDGLAAVTALLGLAFCVVASVVRVHRRATRTDGRSVRRRVDATNP